jgi:hypothetical protein
VTDGFRIAVPRARNPAAASVPALDSREDTVLQTATFKSRATSLGPSVRS